MTMKEDIRNFVAKYARKFNRAVVQKDKKNDYMRNNKHKGDINDK